MASKASEMAQVMARNLTLLLSRPPGKAWLNMTSSDVMKLVVACAVEATKDVQAAEVHSPTMKPARRPYLGPAAAAKGERGLARLGAGRGIGEDVPAAQR